MEGKITYRLLDNQRAVILNRRPVLLNGNFAIGFPQGKDGFTVEVENQGKLYYRELRSGQCRMDASKLQGAVKVTLLETESGSARRKWACEELFVDHTEKGALLCPNDGNLPQTVARLCVENDNIRREFAALEKKFKALDERFTRMMEGFDIT